MCVHRWRTEERGKGHEHECLYADDEPHECQCCCGAIDWAQWDLPARKTPGLKRRKVAA